MSDFICGIDTGGPFTDCVVIDAGGRIVTAKAPSTPRDFSQGVLDSLDVVAGKLGLTTEALLRRTARLALGTTVGTNALLQRRGARVGLITTRGHRDVIHIMWGARGVPGLASETVLHFPESNKPDPIVPKTLMAPRRTTTRPMRCASIGPSRRPIPSSGIRSASSTPSWSSASSTARSAAGSSRTRSAAPTTRCCGTFNSAWTIEQLTVKEC